MLAGRIHGHKTSLSSMFEAVGAYAAGNISEDELTEYENKTCPTCGSCSGMYTANSMNCLTEVLGMGLGGNGTIPAVYSERIRLAKHAGMQVMEMYRRNIRPRDIMTEEAILNALTVDMLLAVPQTACFIFRLLPMRSAWILISALRTASVKKLQTSVTLLRQDLLYMED